MAAKKAATPGSVDDFLAMQSQNQKRGTCWICHHEDARDFVREALTKAAERGMVVHATVLGAYLKKNFAYPLETRSTAHHLLNHERALWEKVRA